MTSHVVICAECGNDVAVTEAEPELLIEPLCVDCLEELHPDDERPPV